jgi:hypothetical protein
MSMPSHQITLRQGLFNKTPPCLTDTIIADGCAAIALCGRSELAPGCGPDSGDCIRLLREVCTFCVCRSTRSHDDCIVTGDDIGRGIAATK